jgi:hypothetical protein
MNQTELLREQNVLRICENRMLRRIFGSKREEVTAGWRKLHNEEFHTRNLFFSPNTVLTKSRRIRLVKCVSRMGDIRNYYKILVGKPE